MGEGDRRQFKILLISHRYPNDRYPVKGIFVKSFVEQLTEEQCAFDLCVAREWKGWLRLPVRVWWRCLRGRPELVHAHFGVPAGVLSALLCSGRPRVTTIHRIEVKHPFLRWLVPIAVRGATRVLCVSQQIAEDVRALVGATKKLAVVHNAVDTDYFAEQPRVCFREQQGLSGEAVIVGSIALFQPRKRLDVVIEAFDKVAARNRNLWLVLAGTGATLDRCKEQARRTSVSSRILFPGVIGGEVKRAFLRECDIFVAPSESEGHSIAVLEAMAAGCVLLLSDIGPNRETITHNVHGLLCQTDAVSLAGAMERLVRDARLRRSLSAAARQRAEEGFSWRARRRRVRALYEELLLESSATR